MQPSQGQVLEGLQVLGGSQGPDDCTGAVHLQWCVRLSPLRVLQGQERRLGVWSKEEVLRNADQLSEVVLCRGKTSLRKNYKNNQKVIILAKKVEKQASKYKSQLKKCQKRLNKNRYIIF